MKEPVITIPISKYLKMAIADIGKISDIFIAKTHDNKVYLCDDIPDFEDGQGIDFSGWFQYLPKDISKYIKIDKNTVLPLKKIIEQIKAGAGE